MPPAIERRQSMTTFAVGGVCTKCSKNWFYVPFLNLLLEYIGSADPPKPEELMVSLETIGLVSALFVAMLTAATQSYGYGDFEDVSVTCVIFLLLV